MLRKLTATLAVASLVTLAHAEAGDLPCATPAALSAPAEEWSLFQTLVTRAPAVMGDVHREFYGQGLDNFGDLRLPAGKGPFPVVVVVHGGRWSADVSLDYMAPLADMLTKAGYATWNIEYSRIGSYGDYPNSFKTVSAATDHLRALAQRYPLDLARTVTIGHSSGGHYALWLAGRQMVDPAADLGVAQALPIRGAVVLDGVVDLAWYATLPRGDVQAKVLGPLQGEALQARLRQVSPAQMPIIQVPQVFISNSSDRDGPVKRYIARAREAGVAVTYDQLCDSNHFTPVDTAKPEIARKLLGYIEQLTR